MSTKTGTGEEIADLVARAGGFAVGSAVLQRLFDEAPDLAFFLKDREGRYLVVNRSLAERHGFAEAGELVGKRPSEVCPGPFGQVPTEQDARVLRTGRALVNHLEMQWFRPHRPCWCLTTKLPLRNEHGEIVGLIGFSRDLREPVPVEDVPGQAALVLEEFETNFGDPVSPRELARRAGVSPARFARLVKRIFGITPTQFITRTRLQAASRFLGETDRTVSEIAHECGFCDHSAFTRAFRSATGLTPTQYRERERAS